MPKRGPGFSSVEEFDAAVEDGSRGYDPALSMAERRRQIAEDRAWVVKCCQRNTPRAPAASSVSKAELDRTIHAIFDAIGDVVDALATRIEALERKPQMSYEGSWKSDRAYHAGSVVSHQGSAWCASTATQGVRPGYGNRSWRLIVKRGRDARP